LGALETNPYNRSLIASLAESFMNWKTVGKFWNFYTFYIVFYIMKFFVFWQANIFINTFFTKINIFTNETVKTGSPDWLTTTIITTLVLM